MENFNFVGFLARWAASIVLVMVTYNPTGTSFVHWVAEVFPKVQPLQAVAGIALIGAWGFFLHSTKQALGTFGMVVATAFFAALVWLFVSQGWLSLSDTGAITWVVLGMLSFLLALGLSWSHDHRGRGQLNPRGRRQPRRPDRPITEARCRSRST
jgi:uncharacterized membrane protein YozB (DUF420 family)